MSKIKLTATFILKLMRCKICTAGAVIGGAGTVLTVGAICSVTPAGWIVGLGAAAGAGLGYLAAR